MTGLRQTSLVIWNSSFIELLSSKGDYLPLLNNDLPAHAIEIVLRPALNWYFKGLRVINLLVPDGNKKVAYN